MSYKVFDTHKLQLLERMDGTKQEPHLSFNEREYAQVYVDRHINKSLTVVQDTLDKDIKKKLETSYGRISYVEDHPDGKGHYAIAKSKTKDSFAVLNIRKESTNHIAQIKNDLPDKKEAYRMISVLKKDMDFDRTRPDKIERPLSR